MGVGLKLKSLMFENSKKYIAIAFYCNVLEQNTMDSNLVPRAFFSFFISNGELEKKRKKALGTRLNGLFLLFHGESTPNCILESFLNSRDTGSTLK